jgi:uncharacterized cupredoxin-like copper-binding protein
MTLRKAMLALAVLVSAAAGDAVDWSGAQTINVLMVDNKFVPDRLNFRHGVPYVLHLENRGKELHEFTAPEFFGHAVMRDPGMLANSGAEIVVQPDMMGDVYLVPLKPGTYQLYCADHDWAGMVGEIVVE